MTLIEAFESLTKKESFQPGDVVVWKKGMKNKRVEGPFVVVEAFADAPIQDDTSPPGSTYFREPLDLVLGHFDSDNDFVLYHYDSRRFTKQHG